jgi:WD40 repeat protein
MSRSAASQPPIVIACAPEDAPALRSVAQRLRIDGLTAWLATDQLGPQAEQPRALREAVRGAAAVIIGLSRRSWGADGQLVPALARLADVLNLTPGRRRLVALKLARCEVPAELHEAEVVELFGYSGYERLVGLLREQVARERPASTPAPPPARPSTPALALRGRFALPALERQGQLRRLGRGVARAVFLLDARHALSVGGGGAALLDLRDGAPLWTIDCPTRHAALSPRGRLLATAAGSLVQIWDLHDGRLAATCGGHSGPVGALAFTPDERTLASVGHDGTLRLWRAGAEGGLPGAALATLPAHSDQVLSVAVSPDGALIATGGADRSVRIWRALDRSLARTLAGHGGAVEALAFSPSGDLLAAGSRGRSARLWDTRTWQLRHALDSHDGAVETLAFSPAGDLLATGSADQVARIWRVADGGLERALRGHAGAVGGVSFGPGGAQLASLGEDDRLIVWEVATGAEAAALRPLSGRVTALAFSADGAQLAVGASDGATAVYDATSEAPPQLRYSEHQGAVTGLAFAAGRRLISTAADRTVRESRLDSAGATILLQTHGAQQTSALAPGGQLLASCDGETTVQLWRLSGPGQTAGGQFWRVLRGMRSRVRLVLFAPDSAAVAVACDDGSVALWHTADLERERDEPALRLPSLVGRPRALAFSSDGAQLAAAGEQGAQIWRVADGAAVRIGGTGAPLSGLAFGRDGLSLAAGDTLGHVAIWRLTAEERRRRGQSPAMMFAGHAGAVEHLAFNPAGGALATGSADGTVRLWKL